MNIVIKFINIESTEAIKERAEKKVSEALQKFVKDSKDATNILAQVELSKTNNHHLRGEMYKASVEVRGFHKKYFVEVIKDDLYASIDEVKDKLEEVISGSKSKRSRITHKVAVKFKNLFKKGN